MENKEFLKTENLVKKASSIVGIRSITHTASQEELQRSGRKNNQKCLHHKRLASGSGGDPLCAESSPMPPHTCACTQAHVYTYILHTYTHIQTHTYIHYIHTHAYAHTHMPTHIDTDTLTYTHTHTHIDTYVYTHEYAHTHLCTHT